MWKCVLLSLVMTVLVCVPTYAQGKAGLLKGLQSNNDSDHDRKDLEGVIWEYKIMQNDEKDRSERTKMTGRMRIKQTSLFAVGKVEYTNRDEKKESKDDNKAGAGNESAAGPGLGMKERLPGKKQTVQSERGNEDIKEQAKGVLSQKLKQKNEEQTGSERMGDLIKQSANEYTFRFDEDDDHPLSGLAVLQPDKTGRGGVWLGHYDEFAEGKKIKRWRIEMRKIEE